MYYALIAKEFRNHEMEGIASLEPNKPREFDHRFLYRIFKKEIVDRDIVFLMAFGLGFDEKLTELFLTRVIRQSGFNFKDYKEAIYYWCLKEKLGYNGILKMLDIYASLSPDGSRFSIDNYTSEYEVYFYSAVNESDFIELLADLKSAEKNYGMSRKDVFINLLNEYKHQICETDSSVFLRTAPARTRHMKTFRFTKLKKQYTIPTRAILSEICARPRTACLKTSVGFWKQNSHGSIFLCC